MMRLAIDKVEPGMEVMSDVFNVNKALLLPKGVVLTDRHLKTLKTWGVESINVVVAGEGDSPGDANEVLTPEVLSAAEKRVAERFKHVTATSPAIEIIKRLALKYSAVHLQSSPSGRTAIELSAITFKTRLF